MFFPTHISQSVLSDIHKCEIFFFRRWCQKLISEKSSDLIAGTLFASACEISRKAFYNDKISLDDAMELGYNSILMGEDTGDSLKSNDRIAFLFKKYLQKYPFQEGWEPVLLNNGSYGIEYEFEFDTGIQHPDFPERNIIFSGKLDMLAEKRIAGGQKIYIVLDEKTTKYTKKVKGSDAVDISEEERLYATNGQFFGYAWAARQLGINISQACVRRVPITANYFPAYELNVDINPFVIENWSKSTFNKIAELAERYKYYKKTGNLFSSFTPVYNEGCNAFFRPCIFKDGCLFPEGEELLFQRFDQKVIDPLTKEHLSIEEYKIRYKI